MRFSNPLIAARTAWATTWPMLQRELRGGSHVSFNYWIRVIAGGVAMLIITTGLKSAQNQPPSEQGISVFSSLHLCLIGLILVFVPGMTADCLSRERREGTLGLLFLTPLTAGGIVIGKSLAQALRAWCLWLSILPALIVPLTLGGLTWQIVARALTVEFSMIIIALASGLLTSSFFKQSLTAIGVSINVAGFATFLIALLLGYLTSWGLGSSGAGPIIHNPVERALVGFLLGSGFEHFYRVGFSPAWLPLITAGYAVFALFYLIVVLILATFRVKWSWQDNPPSARRQWWIRMFSTELFAGRFKRKLRIDGNPIAWLQQYSLRSRINKWGGCLLFVAVESTIIGFRGSMLTYEALEVQVCMALFLGVLYTYAGVSGFIEEKNSGALELILISPVTVKQIIFGRTIGLWKEFLPTAITLGLFQIAISWTDNSFSGRASLPFSFNWMLACAYFSLPIYATYAALRVKWTIGGIALTWIGLLLAYTFAFASTWFPSFDLLGSESATLAFWFTLSSIGFSGLAFFLLHHSLSRRIYSF